MKSPYPPYAEAELQFSPTVETFKGEEFPITECYWLDPVTGQTFDTAQTSEVTINQIYNAYRVQHGLPFTDEFKNLRLSLGFSCTKMSALLGLGVNQYRLYEKGEMPSEAVGRYIKILLRNKSALRDCITNSQDVLTPKERENALKAIEKECANNVSAKLLENRNINNGYAPLNADKFRNVILHFLNTIKAVSPTSLNKLLFYTDFLSYRERGVAITGLSYRALPYGPVPNNWKFIPLLEGVEQEEAEVGTVLTTELVPDYGFFSEDEIKVLDKVTGKLGKMSANMLSALSHEENAWKECHKDVHTPISFDYAFSLKGI